MEKSHKKKIVILAIDINNWNDLHSIPNFEPVWSYSPETLSDPREVGRLRTDKFVFIFYADNFKDFFEDN